MSDAGGSGTGTTGTDATNAGGNGTGTTGTDATNAGGNGTGTTGTDATNAGVSGTGTGGTLQDARAALRERQGPGARYDSPQAPARELAWARLGTAYITRCLDDLTDSQLDGPSLLPGWTRRHVVAHVGYNARALSRLVEWAGTGTETPMYASPEQRDAEILRGATLPAHALRSLFVHSAAHLDVEWRDLPGPAWDARVRTAQGRVVPARETAWMRAREVWTHAVDLDGGASVRDFPPDLIDALLADVLRAWERRGERVDLTLAPPGAERVVVGTGGPTVTGAPSALVRWLTGRGAHGVTSDSGGLPVVPRWF
ncbi:maleylpyruvate isomerase family mycothiol-dependent enzyme [Streptomyces sp. AM 4-1-1]|uniref:maleylpyruvate isomerase family mycothiol-dependent enzyme n=1 Tax=Streptomyces sp. AM 4-1-1 TaxID=3028710 RepID=UPI0023B8ACC1|nr:maleylpyruvate isomerase family mycothiol-dependent enzyme [Streptomyces sp. AM 4-1-1]WEH36026.1 maleylpyruvate isomerase family mycothiol-dependent enzyme [Streptomyces sp. AM 4-1-1]